MTHLDINSILNESADMTDGIVSYITTARFTITSTELFLDLYLMAPNPTDGTHVEARRLHRIAMPLSVAKDLSNKMLVGVNQWENDHGINLPLEPINRVDFDEKNDGK